MFCEIYPDIYDLSGSISFEEFFFRTLTWPCVFWSCGPSRPPRSSIRYESCLVCGRRRRSSLETDRSSYWCWTLERKHKRSEALETNSAAQSLFSWMCETETKMTVKWERFGAPSPREYTLNPDIFLDRTDLGRLSKAGL